MGGKSKAQILHPKEYKAWENMKSRCYNREATGYRNYGGRGIKVDSGWFANFGQFLLDMGKAPTAEHTLDRIDVNDDYYAENCRWATRTEQMRNTRLTTMVDGVPLAELAESAGVNRKTASQRLAKGNDPLKKPARPYGIAAASRETGLSESCIRNRMKRNGLTLEEAKRGTKK